MCYVSFSGFRILPILFVHYVALFCEEFEWPEKTAEFRDATTFFPTKLLLRNERRISILMTRHYPDASSTADWLKQIFSQADLGSDASLGWSF